MKPSPQIPGVCGFNVPAWLTVPAVISLVGCDARVMQCVPSAPVPSPALYYDYSAAVEGKMRPSG